MKLNIIFLQLKIYFKKFYYSYPFPFNHNTYIGILNKKVEKEMRMPMSFDSKKQAAKEANNLGCKGDHKMSKKLML